jgi:octaprenyl-diphosphate synthase
LRPALCLLSAGATGARGLDQFVRMAAACEVLHVAALTHDDVVDKSGFRRGTMSLNARWDDRIAVLIGDCLVVRATMLLTSFGSCALVDSVFGAVRRMTEAELASARRDTDPFTQEHCLQLAEEKTATFFAASCTAPTYITNATHRDALHRYGVAMGIAFQLIDDVLDIAQDQAALGKPSCGDIIEGKKTLPILFMREALGTADRERLVRMTGKPLNAQDRAWAAEVMETSGARERTQVVARAYADKARGALRSLPEGPCKDSMLSLAEFVLSRDS